MKIEIKSRYTGEILFEHDCENNTTKKTLEAAVLRGANLAGANLTDADLGGAYLIGANLIDANLMGANLTRADLRGANLRGADLGGANLTRADLGGAYLAGAYLAGAYLAGAYLAGANLRGAYLAGAYLIGVDLIGVDLACAIGNGGEIMSTQVGKYSIVYTSEFMWIGCRKHPVKTWWKDSEKDADEFTEGQKEWRAKNKRWIQAMVKNNPAIPTGKESVK